MSQPLPQNKFHLFSTLNNKHHDQGSTGSSQLSFITGFYIDFELPDRKHIPKQKDYFLKQKSVPLAFGLIYGHQIVLKFLTAVLQVFQLVLSAKFDLLFHMFNQAVGTRLKTPAVTS
ncbi:hypothetical protein [Pseudomonas sp. BW7P1]|uniref:hypothetical protein n=1 Tax=Pseudomonas TaxID=286 RepID=UPI0021ADD6F4|nr:hypothetical protein [Pseudomonas sp. BW7P1]UWI59519.1 hypothetical protein NWV16_15505 [Pseudomonas sp. BW7P1]